jgi:hypothetical protein
MPDRRSVLKLLGGGVVVAAGAAGGFAATRTPHAALAPWQAAGGPADPRLRALSYAILAPNPHNRQPWTAELTAPDEVAVWRDPELNLPETDPHDRQLTIGMGCFLELMAIAAGETGHAVTFELFPRGETGPVALARLTPGGAPDPLFASVLDRRSCKAPFADRPVMPVPALTALADIHADPARVAALRALTWAAFEVEATTRRTLKESVDLFRMGRSEIEASPDGIDLGGPMLEALMLAGLLTREGQLDPSSREFAQTMAMYREMLTATPAYAVIRTPANARADQVAAGRRWLRLNLTTTALGLALHPVSQALQEYPEMAPHRAAAHDMLARPGETVQMLGRLGYGPEVPPSPRWPLEAKLRHG